MIDTDIPQKRQIIPLSNNAARGVAAASIKRNSRFRDTERAKMPHEENSTMNDVETSMAVVGCFDAAHKHKTSFQVMMIRKHWEYTIARKPTVADKISHTCQIFRPYSTRIDIKYTPTNVK